VPCLEQGTLDYIRPATAAGAALPPEPAAGPMACDCFGGHTLSAGGTQPGSFHNEWLVVSAPSPASLPAGNSGRIGGRLSRPGAETIRGQHRLALAGTGAGQIALAGVTPHRAGLIQPAGGQPPALGSGWIVLLGDLNAGCRARLTVRMPLMLRRSCWLRGPEAKGLLSSVHRFLESPNGAPPLDALLASFALANRPIFDSDSAGAGR